MQFNNIQNIFLNASAGSGKTFALCIRYIALLFKGAKANEILTLTFTKEAANEMKERITNNLYTLYVIYNNNSQDGTLLKYAKDLTQALENYDITKETLKQQIKTIYFDFLQTDKKINTIDSFYTAILRKFAFFIGIRQNFTIQEVGLHEESFLTFLQQSLKNQDLYKIIHYLYQELNLSIYANQFNNTTTLGFLLALLNDKSIEFKDKNDFCYKMSKNFTLQHARQLANKHNLDIQDLKEQIIKDEIYKYSALLSRYLRDITPENKQNSTQLAKIHEQLQSQNLNTIIKHKLIIEKKHTWIKNQIKPNQIQSEEIEYFCNIIQDLATIYAEYIESAKLSLLYQLIENYKATTLEYENKMNTLSFDSITHKVFAITSDTLFKDGKFNSDYFYFCLDSKISHILFDEYQDTSIIQYRIFLPLFQEILAGKGTKDSLRSLFFVGDFKQSLYRFRGANPIVFEQSKEGLLEQSLDYNYRSKKNIIDFVNDKFAPIFADKYICQKYPPNDSLDCGILKVVIFHQDSKERAEIQDLENNIYGEIVKQIEKLIAIGIAKKDIALLARHRKILQEFIAFADKHAKNLQFNLDKRGKLVYQDYVQIIFCAIKVDEYKKILQHLQTQHQQYQNTISQSLFENQDSLQNHDNAMQEIMQKSRAISYELKFMQKKLNKLLGKSYFDNQFISIPNKSSRKSLAQNIKFIIELFKLYNQDCMDLLELASANPQIHSIDELFESIAAIESTRMQEESIHAMTIHGSKGLGFKHVIFIDDKTKNTKKELILYQYDGIYLNALRLNDSKNFSQALKTLQDNNEKENIEQEYNALYVACTRAKDGLYIFAHAESKATTMLHLNESDSRGDNKSLVSTQKIQSPNISKPLIVSYFKNLHTMQEDFVTNTHNEPYLSHINMKKKQIVGICMHFMLEIMLGYKTNNVIPLIESYFGFYLHGNELEKIYKKTQNFLNMKFIDFNLDNNKVKCEVSFLHKNSLLRLDALVQNNEKLLVIEFKSSEKINEELFCKHKTQVQSYMNFLSHFLNSSSQLQGYIIYLQDEIEIKEITIEEGK